MKQWLFSFLMVLTMLTGSVVFAGEFPGNPDRMPSVGLNYSRQNLTGNGDSVFTGGSGGTSIVDKYNTDIGFKNLSLDVRLPVSNSLTFNFSLGKSNLSHNVAGTDFTDFERDSGRTYQVGVRYYFH